MQFEGPFTLLHCPMYSNLVEKLHYPIFHACDLLLIEDFDCNFVNLLMYRGSGSGRGWQWLSIFRRGV